MKDKRLRRRSNVNTDFQDLRTEGSVKSARLPSDYSQPSLQVEDIEKYQMVYSSDFNVTIRSKVELKRKQATLIAGQCLYEVLTKGIGISDWMVLEFLYNFLLGNKQEPLDLKNPKELELALVLKVILLSGTWMDLVGKVEIPEDIRLIIQNSKWVPNKRTYDSRKNQYLLKKYLKIQIVNIDTLFERSKGTKRYSSYCKGYGESSPTGRRQKTRPSAELDGEEVKDNGLVSINTDLQSLIRINHLAMLETFELSRRKR